DRVRPLLESGALASEVTPGMARDGVEARPPKGTGARAWWMIQMLSAVPPAMWGSPGPVAESDTAAAMREGLAWAARRHGDRAWAAALVEHVPEVASVLTEQEVAARVTKVAATLPSPGGVEYVTAVLAATEGRWG